MNIYHWHPAIKASMCGPVVRNVPLHLQQSDLDGACGLHCTLMALMLFGIVKRVDLDTLPRARNRRLSSLWKRTERRYFIGSYARHIQTALEPYAHDIFCSVRHTNCISHVLAVLNDGGVGIVQIGNSDYQHWVLAVGIGGVETRQSIRPACLLVLDPSHAPIPLATWNAMLSVKADSQDRHAYDTPDGRVHVRIETVLALRRSTHET